jgi:hypothetical protein
MDGVDEKETVVKYEKPDSIALSRTSSGKHSWQIKIYADLSKDNYELIIKRLDDLVADLNKRYCR